MVRVFANGQGHLGSVPGRVIPNTKKWYFMPPCLKLSITSLVSRVVRLTWIVFVRRTRHAGHCWRSRDELIRDVLLWTPTHGRAKAGRPARTYIQQLCEDTGCCPEDLPRAMNDREEWRERVRDIRATSARWWWWWWSRVEWSNPGKGVAPSPTLWCSSYRKGNLPVNLYYGRQLILSVHLSLIPRRIKSYIL